MLIPRSWTSRGCCFAALWFASTSFAQTSAPTTREASPPPMPIESLDAVRIDRRMTLLQTGEAIEPFARLDDASPTFVVELASHRELILDLAKRRGTTPPTVRLLPEDSRTPDRFGIVTAEHAILRKSPADVPGDRENLSDVTRGEPVWILDRDDAKTSLLVHASDGYLGWVDAKVIWPVAECTFLEWSKAWSRNWIDSDGQRGQPAAIVPAVTARNASRATAIAREATSPPPRPWTPARAGYVNLPYPTGAEVAIVVAKDSLGTRYAWGGKTKDGIDCSGLTQTAFARAGVALPRDADQQSLVGRLVATRWCLDALLPGDLLFYVSPRRGGVHHVAIYLGNGEYIEAAGQDVHVSSMTPGAPNYDAKRAATFGWARRVIE